MIGRVFGKKIASQVADLTRVKSYGKISAAETLNTLFQQRKHDVLLIKLFDRLHNMQTIGAKSPEKIRKIVDETLEVFVGVSIYLQIPELERQFTQICYLFICQTNPILPVSREHEFIAIKDSFQLLSLTFQYNAIPL